MTMYKENFTIIDNEIVHENPYHYPTYNKSDHDVYNKKQALIDEIYNFEFNYEIKNDISMADIFSELLGDQMGFWDDEPNDWIYKITSIEYYEKVDLKLFQEMLEN